MHNAQQQMRDLIRQEIGRERMPGGLFACWKDGQERFSVMEGMADLATATPLQRDSLFRIYSMTKPLTAVAAMILMEEGRLHMDDPVSVYLPEYAALACLNDQGDIVPCHSVMTIRHLLSMTSGLVYPGNDPAGRFMQRCFDSFAVDNMAGRGPSTREVARMIARQPLAFEPGADWRYGLSADVLGAVIEVVAGQKLSTFMQARIFDPLGMQDTGFFVPAEKAHRLTTLYRSVNGHLQEDPTRHIGLTLCLQPPTFESGGAGLISTLDDYARFANTLAMGGGKLLSAATIRLFQQGMIGDDYPTWRQIDKCRGYRYGCLMRAFQDAELAGAPGTPGEFGWDGWTGPYVSMDPVHHSVMIFLMQVGGFNDWALTLAMRRIALPCLHT